MGSGAGAGVGVGPSPLASGVHAPLFRRRGSGAAPSSGLLSCPSSSSQLLSLAPKEQGARKRTGGLLPGIARIGESKTQASYRKPTCCLHTVGSPPPLSDNCLRSPSPSSVVEESFCTGFARAPISLLPNLDSSNDSDWPCLGFLLLSFASLVRQCKAGSGYAGPQPTPATQDPPGLPPTLLPLLLLYLHPSPSPEACALFWTQLHSQLCQWRQGW